MSIREWLLSIGFVAFVGLKLAEGWLVLEEWPLTHAPMFEAPHPFDEIPRRAKIQGLRDGQWSEMRPFLFGLNPAELEGRLLLAEDVGAACATLVRTFNAAQRPHRRIVSAYVSMKTIARPQAPERGSEVRTDCVLEESVR